MPPEARGGIVGDVTAFRASRRAVDEEFDLRAVGIDPDLLRLARLSPAVVPAVAEEVHHRLLRPVALKDVVALLRRAVAGDHTLLVHPRHRVLRPQRCGKVFEDPRGGTGEVRHLLLFVQVPVEEVDHVALRPVAILRHPHLAPRRLVGLAHLGGPLPFRDLLQHLLRILGEPAGVAVAAPLGVKEVWRVGDRLLRGPAILAVAARIPAGPDARGVDVDHILTEVAAADRRLARRIERVGEAVEFGHEGADRLLVKRGKVAGPVVLVAEAPEDHRRVVPVLVDQRPEHVAALLPVAFAAEPAAAPGDFLPDEQPQLVAEVEDERCLLIVAEADEVGPHLLDLGHRAADHVVGHGCRDSRVVFVVMRAAEEQPLAVELEGPVRHPLHAPEAKPFVQAVLAVGRGERHGAGVEPRRCGRPGGRRGNREGVEFLLALPRSGLQFTAVDQHAGWITDLDRDRHLVGEPLGVVEPPADRAAPLSVGEHREHVQPLQRHGRHVHEGHLPVEAAVAVEVAEVGGDRFRIP